MYWTFGTSKIQCLVLSVVYVNNQFVLKVCDHHNYFFKSGFSEQNGSWEHQRVFEHIKFLHHITNYAWFGGNHLTPDVLHPQQKYEEIFGH